MKKTSVLPEASTESTKETAVAERAARPKKSAPLKTRARPSAAKVQAPSDTPTPKPPKASKMATKTNTRSPARSATQTKPRKSARLKTHPLPLDTESAFIAETLSTEKLLAEEAPATVSVTSNPPALAKTSADSPPSPATAPPVVNDAELWEQGSPIRIRIAQLRTRNALLEEQLQRLRPPLQVRGKKNEREHL